MRLCRRVRRSVRRIRRLLMLLIIISTTVAVFIGGQQPSLADAARRNAENNLTNATLLCIFTTFKPVDFKQQIYKNVIMNWASLTDVRRVLPILYVAAEDKTSNITLDIISLAVRLGWKVLVAPRVNEFGVPYIKEMFLDVQRRFPDCIFTGFSNGDILFTNGLVHTLEAVYEVLGVLKRTMVIGRRTNFLIGNRSIYLPEDVSSVARREGSLFISNAQDYFFTAGGEFPWLKVPDLVVGRPAYDNFLVATALQSGVAVVDSTESLLAAHQSDRDGNYAGHNKTETDRDFNVAAIGRFVYRKGYTTHSQYVTKVSRNDNGQGQIAVHFRFGRGKRIRPKSSSRFSGLFWF